MDPSQIPVTINKTTGFLTLLPEQILFYEGSGLQVIKDTVSMAIPLSEIVTQLQNTQKPGQDIAESKFLLKLQLKNAPKPITISFIDHERKQEHRNLLRDALVPVIARNKTLSSKAAGLSEQEASTRLKVLEENPELAKLHKSLVQRGIIDENEFWETRKTLLLSESLQASQKRGAGPELLQEVKPQPTETQDVKVVLTAEKIKAIFMQNPSVERAYAELVPDQLTEIQFWKRYFTSRFFRGGKIGTSDATAASSAVGALGNSGADDSTELFDKYIAEIEASLDADGATQRKPDRKIHMFLDLSTVDIPESDYIVGTQRPDVTMRPGSNRKSAVVIRKCNKLCEMVLKNATDAQDSSELPAVAVQTAPFYPSFDDLDPAEPAKPVPLRIEDDSAYFQSIRVDDSTTPTASSPSTSKATSALNAVWSSRAELVRTSPLGLFSITAPSQRSEHASAEFFERYASRLVESESSGVFSVPKAKSSTTVSLPQNPSLDRIAFEKNDIASSNSRLFGPDHQFAANTLGASSELDGVSAAVLLQASQLVANTNELLHHFWAAWNHVTMSKSASNAVLSKAERMIRVISQSKSNLDSFVSVLANSEANVLPEHRQADKVAMLFSSVSSAVEHALSLYKHSKLAQAALPKSFPIINTNA